MDPHITELPKKIVLGSDIYEKIPLICRDLKLKGPALLVTGPATQEVAGNEIMKYLSEEGYSTQKVIVNEPSSEEVKKVEEIAKNFNFILGVGGGKCIDIAKCSSYSLGIPFLSVPTSPSHDGIASDRATINTKNRKHSYRAKPPLAVICDLNVIKNAPYKLIAAGCGDLISNISAVGDWKLASKDTGEYYSNYTAALSLLSAEIVLNSVELIKERDERGIRNLIQALITSGIAMGVAGSSRPCSGAEHMFSHALDNIAEKPALHGEQCAFGTLLMMKLRGEKIDFIKDKMKYLGLPTTLEDLGISKEEAEKALLEADNIRNRYTILRKGMDAKKARDLIENF